MDASRVGANALGGSIASEATSGKFRDGFKMAGLTSAARYLYNTSTNFEQDATWDKGKGLPVDSKGNIGVYDETGKIPFENNITGNNLKLTGDYWTDAFKQSGQGLSYFINDILPGGVLLQDCMILGYANRASVRCAKHLLI